MQGRLGRQERTNASASHTYFLLWPGVSLGVCHNCQTWQIPKALGDKSKTWKVTSKSHTTSLMLEVWRDKISWNPTHFCFWKDLSKCKAKCIGTMDTSSISWAGVSQLLSVRASLPRTNGCCAFLLNSPRPRFLSLHPKRWLPVLVIVIGEETRYSWVFLS